MTAALDAILTFGRAKDFFTDVCSTLYPKQKKVLIDQGPDTDTDLENLSADRILFIMVGSGPGLSYDGMCDRVTVRLRWIGKQGNYDDAETFANACDLAFLTAASVGGVRIINTDRQGGRPSLLKRDSGDRYHFTCSYVTETASGL